MKVGWFSAGFFAGLGLLVVAIAANNAVRTNQCARQFNVYDCELATVLLPRGVR